MSGLLIILSFCLTTAGVGYLFMNYFIRKDLAVHKKYENLTPIEVSDLYEIMRRNYKIAALMFITSLISNTVSVYVSHGWESGSFGLFLVSSDFAVMMFAVSDIIENSTYFYRFLSSGLRRFILYLTLFSWCAAVFLFFYWITWLAVIIVIAVCILGVIIYCKVRKDKHPAL